MVKLVHEANYIHPTAGGDLQIFCSLFQEAESLTNIFLVFLNI